MNTENNRAVDAAAVPRKKSNWKIILISCTCAFLVLVLSGGIFAYYKIKAYALEIRDEYTSIEAVELPTLDSNKEQIKATVDRVKEFTDGIKKGGEVSALILNSDDINILINHHPDWIKVKDKLHITLEGDKIKGETCFPLDKFGEMFTGRYLNGVAVFRVEMKADDLQLFLDSVEVSGKPIPAALMTALKSENLAKDLNTQEPRPEIFNRIDSITVADGNITIVPKSKE